MTSDGSGGALLVWSDYRNAYTTDADIYLQRVLPSGQIAPGWPVNGLPVCTAIGIQYAQRMATDGAGGVVIAWSDKRSLPTQSVDGAAMQPNSGGRP
jgi:hypothetical protein